MRSWSIGTQFYIDLIHFAVLVLIKLCYLNQFPPRKYDPTYITNPVPISLLQSSHLLTERVIIAWNVSFEREYIGKDSSVHIPRLTSVPWKLATSTTDIRVIDVQRNIAAASISRCQHSCICMSWDAAVRFLPHYSRRPIWLATRGEKSSETGRSTRLPSVDQ